MVSADGVLQEPFLLIMQESTASGDFGPRVNVCRPLNAQVVASKSGKMTKENLHNWVKFVYVEAVQHSPHSLLIVDSWSAFKDFAGMDQCIPNGHEFLSRLIPEGTTSEIQTLDVYGFRIIKAFIRKRRLGDNGLAGFADPPTKQCHQTDIPCALTVCFTKIPRYVEICVAQSRLPWPTTACIFEPTPVLFRW